MSLDVFHPLVKQWFVRRFSAPTDAQLGAWPAIARGEDTLVAAPTGSGKTLAAFLAFIDSLVRARLAGAAQAAEALTSVVYVSPLRALSNDIEKNLQAPLREIQALAAAEGVGLAPISVAVRTGDTPASARARMNRKPPDILVTTPESLYIMLTAEGSRRYLSGARALIVDEIHAVAGSKRGSHLALTLERLERLVRSSGRARPVRVGLSATQRPIETIGGLLVGARAPAPTIVDVGHSRPLDLAVELTDDELGAICSNEQMARVQDRIAELVTQHRTTLVFCNTRRMVERLSRALGERLGDERVAAHHGALSRHRRLEAERRLKSGEARCVVATASLELGIDVGDVDLVVQLGSVRAIATFLQRVGRSGHSLGATPKGRIFPVTRDQLVECAALLRCVRAGELDAVCIPERPLDVLAQQIVAAAASEDELCVEGLFELMRGAWPYRGLERSDFERVLAMLADGVATERGRAGARIHWDRVGGRVRARRGARIAALTSGGAIPERGDYAVILEPDEVRIGTVDEDFAIESLPGNVFLLGNAPWRIRRIEQGRVRVEDATGASPMVPFWFGEAPARTVELSRAVAGLREAIVSRLEAGRGRAATAEWVARETLLPPEGAGLVVDYVRASRAMLGAVPSTTTVVAERFFDSAGGMQLVLHAPFGARITRAWGLALRKCFCRTFDFELQAAAIDDGLVLSLGPGQSFPLETVFQFLRSHTVERVVQQAVLTSPIFGGRWRWTVTRALAVLRQRGGKRVPAQLLRMRSDDLLAAVFPSQVACQENVSGPLEPPDHPLVQETLDDCLRGYLDVDGLKEVLAGIEAGEIRTVAVDSTEPSPLSHEILNANPYAFLDDAPLEERRTRAVVLSRSLPDLDVGEGLSGLDPAVVAEVVASRRPRVRDRDELHDLLLTVGALPEGDPLLPEAGDGALAGWFERLVDEGRAVVARHAGGVAWVARERMRLAGAALSQVAFAPELPLLPALGPPLDAEGARAAILRGFMSLSAPATAAEIAARLGWSGGEVDLALASLELAGVVLQGRWRAGEGPGQWCDRAVLAAIHKRTIRRLRKSVQPVTPADLMRLLVRWQHAAPGTRLSGVEGLRALIGRLQGVEAPVGAWEAEILPARLEGYDPAWLDRLCFEGEVAWARLSPVEGASAPSRSAPVALVLRDDLGWLLPPRDAVPELSAGAAKAFEALAARGALFVGELEGATGLPRHALDEALWELVGQGLVTSDGFAALRVLLQGREPGPSPRRRSARAGGRWSLLRSTRDEALTPELAARQLLERYGVVFRDLVVRESWLPPWRSVLRELRRLEARGEIRGGRFVKGFVGEQFALPEALDALRALRRARARDEGRIALAASDPLNLTGGIIPGPRVPTLSQRVLVLERGRLEGGQ